MHSALCRSSAYQEQTMMIKVIEAHYMGNLEVSLKFSDGAEGIFDGRDFLNNQGSLLDALRVETFFTRFLSMRVRCAGQTD
jgi:hypothetical protein